MVILPKLRCPNCGKGMGPIKAKEVPPANTYDECLRRCPRCRIGATNAKSFAKIKFIRADTPPAAPAPQDAPPPKPQ